MPEPVKVSQKEIILKYVTEWLSKSSVGIIAISTRTQQILDFIRSRSKNPPTNK